jgi:uncharacterized protein YqjF (DUF2071 family)
MAVAAAPLPAGFDREAPPLSGPVVMNQDWRDLTYLHWALDPARVAPLLPAGVSPDVLGGVTYLGLVPFRMARAGLGRRGRVPYLGDFLETNLRLYTIDSSGRRGVHFLTLDCERALVTLGARAAFGVPYRWATMRHQVEIGASTVVHHYRSRVRAEGASLELSVEVGDRVEPDDLDVFLSARWGLHTRVLGRTAYVPNEHEPWPLHRASVLALRGTLLEQAGFGDLDGRAPDHVAFSPGVHTVFGLPRR